MHDIDNCRECGWAFPTDVMEELKPIRGDSKTDRMIRLLFPEESKAGWMCQECYQLVYAAVDEE
jgi:hypothetical protein